MNRKLLVFMLLSISLLALSFTPAAAQDAEAVTADYLLFFGGQGGYAGTTEGIRGIATTGDGNVLVADVYNNISEFNMYGELVEVHTADADGENFTGVTGMTTDDEGNIYVGFAEPNRVRVYDGDWALVREYDGDAINGSATSLAFDDANEILYAFLIDPSNGEAWIRGVSIDGEVTSEFAPPPSGAAINTRRWGSLDVNTDGNLVVGVGGIARANGALDAIEGKLVTFEPDGTMISEWPLDYTEREERTTAGMETFRFFPTPFGIRVDAAGNVFSYEVNWMHPDPPSGAMSVYAPNGAKQLEFTVSATDNPWEAKSAISADGSLLYVASANFVHIISLTDEPPYTTVRMAENGRLRSGPGSNFDVLGSLEAGKTVVVTGANEAGDWLQVRFNSAEAWVADFLTEPIVR